MQDNQGRLRRWVGVKFVRRAPSRSGRSVDLRVSHMRPEHAIWWQSHVQPVIDDMPGRADRGWNWLVHFPFTTLAGRVLRQRPAGFTVGIVSDDPDGPLVPCVMVQLLARFRLRAKSVNRSAYLWYLSAAPVAALTDVPEHPMTPETVPKRLGTIGLDVAVTHSFNRRRRGRVALYADEEGGSQLLDWYQSRGMAVLSPDQRLPRSIRRLVKPSDGRYCYYTDQGALEASRALDDLR